MDSKSDNEQNEEQKASKENAKRGKIWKVF